LFVRDPIAIELPQSHSHDTKEDLDIMNRSIYQHYVFLFLDHYVCNFSFNNYYFFPSVCMIILKNVLAGQDEAI